MLKRVFRTIGEVTALVIVACIAQAIMSLCAWGLFLLFQKLLPLDCDFIYFFVGFELIVLAFALWIFFKWRDDDEVEVISMPEAYDGEIEDPCDRHNPNGVYCGECTRPDCEGCANEHLTPEMVGENNE